MTGMTINDSHEGAPLGLDSGSWLRRWEAQQDAFMPDREQRFELMFETLATLLGDGPMTVLDLGCGPGSLAGRLLARFP
ncbi:MAG: SAM-dependent methyltransferase, partial [Candidatus Dormiibacterota bacterium]